MNKIYAKLAAFLLGKFLGGQKTLILGWATTILGIIQLVFSTDTMHKACELYNICLEGNPVFGAIFIALGELTKLVRYATGQDYKDPRFKP